MREIDERGLNLCKFQGELFEKSLLLNCSSPTFIKNFMKSEYAWQLDKSTSLFEATDKEQILNSMATKYSNKGTIKYSENEMFWIGYTYRYWCYTYKMHSKNIFNIISGSKMKQLYLPYHSLDCNFAIQRIMEAEQVPERKSLYDIIKSNTIQTLTP